MARMPRSAVFTTALWDGNSKIADFDKHVRRLKNHAERLRIDLPENPEQLIAQTIINRTNKYNHKKLLNITFDSASGEFKIIPRELPKLRNCMIDAMTIPIKKWLGQVTGTKHGDWDAYRKITTDTFSKGADVALLVHEHCIVDGDRVMPLVLDEDGVVWISGPEFGGVDSVTFDVCRPEIEAAGFVISEGRLNERLVARAKEFVLLGSGMGAARLTVLDDVDIGDGSNKLQQVCIKALGEDWI